MSEDRFFNQVREKLHDFAPEVPQGVYAAMRRKLWWSNFTKLSVTRFNVWYAILIMTIGGVWFANRSANSSSHQIPQGMTEQTVIPKFKSFDTICAPKSRINQPNVVDEASSTKEVAAHPNAAKAKKKVATVNRNHSGSIPETPTVTPVELPGEMANDATAEPTEVAETAVDPENEMPGNTDAVTGETTRKGTAFPVVIFVDDSLNSTNEKDEQN